MGYKKPVAATAANPDVATTIGPFVHSQGGSSLEPKKTVPHIDGLGDSFLRRNEARQMSGALATPTTNAATIGLFVKLEEGKKNLSA